MLQPSVILAGIYACEVCVISGNAKITRGAQFRSTIRNNFKGIVKSIKTGITNAAAEGINSKIQMAKSRVRGLRNIDNFKAMIYFLENNFDSEFH